MSRLTLVFKKFEMKNEEDASALSKTLNANKYVSITLGKAVVSNCRVTKKLDKILIKYEHDEVILSDTDKNEINVRLTAID